MSLLFILIMFIWVCSYSAAERWPRAEWRRLGL
jgi:hypothetical protein